MEVRIISGSQIGEWKLPLTQKRRKFTFFPALVSAIEKAQGQIFEATYIYLPKPVFARGQLYVALSRVRHPRNYKVMGSNPQLGSHGGAIARNAVFPEVRKA